MFCATGALGQTTQYATPYAFIAAQADMKLVKDCIDNMLPKNQVPWIGPKKQTFTLLLPTDEGLRGTLSALGLRITAEELCRDPSGPNNQTRNAVMRYHVLKGSRTRAQLLGNCKGGCVYDTMSGGRTMDDTVRVLTDPGVGTYFLGGSEANQVGYVTGRPPPPNPPPPPSPFAAFASLADFIRHRVSDLSRLSVAVDAAGLTERLSNPALQWTCFFPSDTAPQWDKVYEWPGGNATLLQQSYFVAGCREADVLMKPVVDPACRPAVRAYGERVVNMIVQHCVDRAGLPHITTASWSNASYVTAATFGRLLTRRAGDVFWITRGSNDTLVPDEQAFLLSTDGPGMRARDNVVAASVAHVVGAFLEYATPAPPPPPPPSPPPPTPSPPAPEFGSFALALSNSSYLSVTNQLVGLLNLTSAINNLDGTTCFFPSNRAWALFGADANDNGSLLDVAANGTAPPMAAGSIARRRAGLRRRVLLGARRSVVVTHADGDGGAAVARFCLAAGGVCAAARLGRRQLAEISNPHTDPLLWLDTLSWDVTLQTRGNVSSLTLLRNTVLNSCYNPPSANLSSTAGNVMARRLNETDGYAWETALGWTDVSGLLVVQTPFTGNCSNNATVGTVAGVQLASLGYCTQCTKYDNVSGSYSGCGNFTVYSLLTGGVSAYERGIITNNGYSRGRNPFVYWMPHDIVVGSTALLRGYIQIVDRIVQPPPSPPPPAPPSPRPLPPLPRPPPPLGSLKTLLDSTSSFTSCASRLFAARLFAPPGGASTDFVPSASLITYYDYVATFDTSGWTLFIPSDTACLAMLASKGLNVTTAIDSGIARSLLKNMFVPNGLYPTTTLTNDTVLTTDLGLYFDASGATSSLTFAVANGSVSVSQTFPGYATQTANLTGLSNFVVNLPAALGSSTREAAGYVHQISRMLFPDLRAPSPPPMPPPPSPPPMPPPSPPPPAFTSGLDAYLANYPELSILRSLMACTNLTAVWDAEIANASATFLAPSNTAWATYLPGQGFSLADAAPGGRMCNDTNLNSTARLLRAHLFVGAYPTSLLVVRPGQFSNIVQLSYFYPDEFFNYTATASATSNNSAAVTFSMSRPPTSASLVAGRFNTPIYSAVLPASASTRGVTVAHMINRPGAGPTQPGTFTAITVTGSALANSAIAVAAVANAAQPRAGPAIAVTGSAFSNSAIPVAAVANAAQPRAGPAVALTGSSAAELLATATASRVNNAANQVQGPLLDP
ncbi:hypothetical protein GPECTOR_26g494 [Gonium pectorale]|uniref:FAS1 domain-containing protein n=1 Tax=Gonium pectorale TaxID=33097 RepID=A0A150GFF8_GONPE|nr:hypothetical protein GPECTOR_26g494 [Gonium pectorale]|eukprot:KXZ48591.1 hypothetical protein GPECTOR_26g494 [Gonium pectorale]